MSIKFENQFGVIEIDNQVIKRIVGNVVTQCCGVAGFASSDVKNGFVGQLRRDSVAKGINILTKNNRLVLSLYIVVEYGVRIPDIAIDIRKKVVDAIKLMTEIDIKELNIMVQGISLDKVK